MGQSPLSSLLVDAVLVSPPPQWSTDRAVEVAAATFAVDAASASNLGSERDQTFMLHGRDGLPLAVMKVSNPAESTETLDMEMLGVRHASRVDPQLTIARPRHVPGTDDDIDPANHHDTGTA